MLFFLTTVSRHRRMTDEVTAVLPNERRPDYGSCYADTADVS